MSVATAPAMFTARSSATIQLADTGLARYLEEIRRFPMLAADEEYRLAKRLREDGDAASAETLITSYLRFVGKVAMSYRFYGLPIADVIEEGNIGLMTAVSRFDPDRGCRLATYANWWIRAAIQDYVLRSWSLVRMGTTNNQKKLFFGLRRTKARLAAYEDGDLHPGHVTAIATLLGVHDREVVAMNRWLAGDRTLNAPIANEAGAVEWLDLLVDGQPSPEDALVAHEQETGRHAALYRALGRLKPRERHILEARRLWEEPMKLEALAAEYGVSRERIRQIELRAFEKVQEAISQEQPIAPEALPARLARPRRRRPSATDDPSPGPRPFVIASPARRSHA